MIKMFFTSCCIPYCLSNITFLFLVYMFVAFPKTNKTSQGPSSALSMDYGYSQRHLKLHNAI